jgi:hypothetical protein
MLRGLSPKYRHTVPVITAKNPPHTFLSARSYLLLEKQYDKEHVKSAAQHALHAAAGGPRLSASTAAGGSSTVGAPRSSQLTAGGTARNDNYSYKKRRGCGNTPPGGNSGNASAGTSSSADNSAGNCSQSPWVPGFNPWTDMVQAWPMPFWVPSAGVLGPRPGAPHQANLVGTPPPAPATPSSAIPSTGDVWNQQVLLAALATASVPPTGP